MITRRTKWFQNVKPIEQGDVVIIVDENSARNCWLKGIVIETTLAKNGQVRHAVVRTKNGILKRPVLKLAVLNVLDKSAEP